MNADSRRGVKHVKETDTHIEISGASRITERKWENPS